VVVQVQVRFGSGYFLVAYRNERLNFGLLDIIEYRNIMAIVPFTIVLACFYLSLAQFGWLAGFTGPNPSSGPRVNLKEKRNILGMLGKDYIKLD